MTLFLYLLFAGMTIYTIYHALKIWQGGNRLGGVFLFGLSGAFLPLTNYVV